MTALGPALKVQSGLSCIERILALGTPDSLPWFRLLRKATVTTGHEESNRGSSTIRRKHSTSCGAAVRVEPRARLCEPWVMLNQMESREVATETS
jgi:hypothetical protein